MPSKKRRKGISSLDQDAGGNEAEHQTEESKNHEWENEGTMDQEGHSDDEPLAADAAQEPAQEPAQEQAYEATPNVEAAAEEPHYEDTAAVEAPAPELKNHLHVVEDSAESSPVHESEPVAEPVAMAREAAPVETQAAQPECECEHAHHAKVNIGLLSTIEVDKELYTSLVAGGNVKGETLMRYAQPVAEKLGNLFGKIINGYQKVFKIVIEDKLYLYEKRANYCLRKAKYESSITMYEEVLRQKPENVAVTSKLGYAYLMAGMYDRAIALFEAKLAQGEIDDKTTFYLGYALYKSGDESRALRLFREILAANHDHIAAHFRVGMILMSRGDYDQAIANFEKALALGPEIPLIYQNMGLCFEKKGDYQESIKYLKKMIPTQG